MKVRDKYPSTSRSKGMVWHEDPNHPFAGIAEKLKRADQNIGNLHAEIGVFFKRGKYPVLPHPDDKRWQEAVDYHRSKPIPVRFGVLAGEIIHHLRSSLDHIVWHFSSDEARLKAQNVIEFPLFESKPLSKEDIQRYNRKIQGITNTQTLTWIEEMQPYNAGTDVADDPLLIVHNMNRFDKHRELIIVDSSALIHFPASMGEITQEVALYTQGKLPVSGHAAATQAVKDHGIVTPQVAFRQFGKRQAQPVIAGLLELFNEVSTLVGVFATQV
jgi:hypothetical protein